MFWQQVVNGLMVGSTYSLIALGFTLIFGIMGVLNLAHPELFMVGAYVGGMIMVAGGNFLLALLGGMLAGGCLGLVVERVAIRPIRRFGPLTTLIATIGVSLFLQNLAVRVWGPARRPFGNRTLDQFFGVLGIQVTPLQLTILATSLVLMVLLHLLVHRTWMGRAIRATASSETVAGLLGINANTVNQSVMVIASALAAAGGVMIGSLYNSVWPFMGMGYGLKALVVMIVGGVGNMTGAMLSGLVLGIAETLSVAYISSNYRDAVAFALLILLLLVRPEGLLGARRIEKV